MGSDADAYYYGAYGLGYHGLGYRTYGYGYPYAHHGYAYYGKRSLMLSQRPMLMPTTATTVMVPGPTTATVWATDTVWDTEATTMDKFSASEVQSRSSKRTSLLVI